MPDTSLFVTRRERRQRRGRRDETASSSCSNAGSSMYWVHRSRSRSATCRPSPRRGRERYGIGPDTRARLDAHLAESARHVERPLPLIARAARAYAARAYLDVCFFHPSDDGTPGPPSSLSLVFVLACEGAALEGAACCVASPSRSTSRRTRCPSRGMSASTLRRLDATPPHSAVNDRHLTTGDAELSDGVRCQVSPMFSGRGGGLQASRPRPWCAVAADSGRGGKLWLWSRSVMPTP